MSLSLASVTPSARSITPPGTLKAATGWITASRGGGSGRPVHAAFHPGQFPAGENREACIGIPVAGVQPHAATAAHAGQGAVDRRSVGGPRSVAGRRQDTDRRHCPALFFGTHHDHRGRQLVNRGNIEPAVPRPLPAAISPALALQILVADQRAPLAGQRPPSRAAGGPALTRCRPVPRRRAKTSRPGPGAPSDHSKAMIVLWTLFRSCSRSCSARCRCPRSGPGQDWSRRPGSSPARSRR